MAFGGACHEAWFHVVTHSHKLERGKLKLSGSLSADSCTTWSAGSRRFLALFSATGVIVGLAESEGSALGASDEERTVG
eukprot:3729483-Amphidinium_carterae.2